MKDAYHLAQHAMADLKAAVYSLLEGAPPEGLTNAQIAGKLFLAESTVKSHLSSSFTKLGVSSRYEAATLILDPERGRRLGFRELPA